MRLYYDKALSINPMDTAALNYKGSALVKIDKYDEAIPPSINLYLLTLGILLHYKSKPYSISNSFKPSAKSNWLMSETEFINCMLLS